MTIKILIDNLNLTFIETFTENEQYLAVMIDLSKILNIGRFICVITNEYGESSYVFEFISLRDLFHFNFYRYEQNLKETITRMIDSNNKKPEIQKITLYIAISNFDLIIYDLSCFDNSVKYDTNINNFIAGIRNLYRFQINCLS